MNKKELIKAVALQTEMTQKDAGIVVDAVFSTITKELAEGNEVNIVGFGKFVLVYKEAHEARNPQNGDTVSVEAKNVPKFKASSNLKEACK